VGPRCKTEKGGGPGGEPLKKLKLQKKTLPSGPPVKTKNNNLLEPGGRGFFFGAHVFWQQKTALLNKMLKNPKKRPLRPTPPPHPPHRPAAPPAKFPNNPFFQKRFRGLFSGVFRGNPSGGGGGKGPKKKPGPPQKFSLTFCRFSEKKKTV